MLKNRLQITRVGLMGFGEVTNLEESQLEELRFKRKWGGSRMERPQVRMGSREKW